MRPAPETIRAMLERAATREGRRPALISADSGLTIGYDQLPAGLTRIACRLRELGVGSGEPVAYLLDNGLFTAQVLLGALAASRVAVPLNPTAGVAHLARVLSHCGARLIFVAQEYRDLCATAARTAGVDPILLPAESDTVLAAPSTADFDLPGAGSAEDDAALFYTSGTTGAPKGVRLSHRGLLAGAAGTVRSHALGSEDRSLCVLPLYHLNAVVATLLPTLLSGGAVVLARRFDPTEFWTWVSRYGCTWVGLAPTLVSRLLLAAERTGAPPASDRSLRFARCSSAPLEHSLQQAFEERFGVPVIEAMGMTEAGATIFTQPLPPGARKAGSVGLPVGFEVRVVDRDGAEQPAGSPGELLVRGPSVMNGYFRDPEATSSAIDREGWLRTGDQGYRDADGHCFITGRIKEIILKAGEQIAPAEIDHALARHPAVLEAAATGVPAPHTGQDIVAFVVLRPGARCEIRDLQRFCEGEIGAFRTPTRILLVPELPRGPTGKILRSRLAERAAEHRIEAADGGDSSARLAGTVAGIFAGVLKVDAVPPTGDFFELGGHSLTATQVVARIRDALGVSLPLDAVFEAPTAKELAERIASGRKPA